MAQAGAIAQGPRLTRSCGALLATTCPYFERRLPHEFLVGRHRGGKAVVAGLQSAGLVLVLFEQRELLHPEKVELLRVTMQQTAGLQQSCHMKAHLAKQVKLRSAPKRRPSRDPTAIPPPRGEGETNSQSKKNTSRPARRQPKQRRHGTSSPLLIPARPPTRDSRQAGHQRPWQAPAWRPGSFAFAAPSRSSHHSRRRERLRPPAESGTLARGESARQQRTHEGVMDLSSAQLPTKARAYHVAERANVGLELVRLLPREKLGSSIRLDHDSCRIFGS